MSVEQVSYYFRKSTVDDIIIFKAPESLQKGKVMKRKYSIAPVEGEAEPTEEEVDGGEEQRLRIVDLVCDGIDHESESRSAAIMAIGNGHMANAITKLQLMMSNFPEHIRKMPLKKFVKQHCPHIKVTTRLDGTMCFELVQDPAFQPPGEGILDASTSFSSVQNAPGC